MSFVVCKGRVQSILLFYLTSPLILTQTTHTAFNVNRPFQNEMAPPLRDIIPPLDKGKIILALFLPRVTSEAVLVIRAVLHVSFCKESRIKREILNGMCSQSIKRPILKTPICRNYKY